MAYDNAPVQRSDTAGKPRISLTNYDSDIDNAKRARNNQLKDTDPMVEKEGFLAVDDLDRMRRRKIR